MPAIAQARMLNKRAGLPIRLRLVLTFSLLLMLTLLAVGLVLYFVVAQTLNGRLEKRLQDEVNSLIDDNSHYADAPLILPGPLKNSDDSPLLDNQGAPLITTSLTVNNNSFPETALLYRPDGTVQYDPPGGLTAQPAVLETALAARSLPAGQGKLAYVVLTGVVQDQEDSPANASRAGPHFYLLYARSLYAPTNPKDPNSPVGMVGIFVDSRSYDDTSALLDTMRLVLLISLPLALLLCLGVANLVAGRVLRPIKLITATARQIGATDLSRRLGLTSRDELGQLAQTFDQMVARLETGFKTQRRFIADASHELRTPLAVIEAEASLMLQRERDKEDYRRALELIASESGRMGQLLEEMLLLARADNNEFELHPRPIALDELLVGCVEAIDRLARLKNQQIQLELSEEATVAGDEELLKSLFTNLLSNAVKYTPEQGQIKVRLGSGSPGQILVEVRDSGAGIAPEHLPHLFERFYQVDRARTRKGSAGLGLAVAQWVAEVHRGRIEVQSVPGQGTVFYVYLPLA